jgi:hypothetical protein
VRCLDLPKLEVLANPVPSIVKMREYVFTVLPFRRRSLIVAARKSGTRLTQSKKSNIVNLTSEII